MKNRLSILHVSSEVAPYAKTGGLADVVGSLPAAQSSLDHDVRVILPFYRVVGEGNFEVRKVISKFEVPISGTIKEGELFEAESDRNVKVYCVRQDTYFDRAHLYGTPEGDYPDNAERFAFLCRSLLPVCDALDLKPDIIHCHDWQTGLIPSYVRTLWSDEILFANTSCCYTIHNLAYQGLFPREVMALIGLPDEEFTAAGVEFWGRINFMKAGINYSDVITTVSPKYSREIQTPEYGYGLDSVLRERSEDLFGILNGIDTDVWDPENDRFLKANYSVHDLSGKKKCKDDILETFKVNIDSSKAPLFGVISRLADQKGFDLLAEIMDDLMTLDVGLVLLGTGDQRYQDMFQKIAVRYPGKMGVRIAFDNALAHKIEAGCDVFLMPSKYEPCGLNQMYSLRYGTVPLVRATGGLDDTVEHYDPRTGRGNGFKFYDYAADELFKKIREAIEFYHDREAWSHLMRNAMQTDFSWARSARRYLEIYENTIEKRMKGVSQ
ncbi:MAG: glycogen synthase GlgA [Gemmatimonadota bacterium]|nr:MAG: glycogen synthase GlgA [Gemmatimonadota bacterium]